MRSRRRPGVPYGQKVSDSGAIVRDAEEQDIIAYIVLEHWKGISFGMIAAWLTDGEVTAPGGGAKWHGSSVEKVWDRVTNGQMKRIEKAADAAKKAEQEAYHASEAGQMAAEIQRRQEPEVQLERKGYVEIDTSVRDLRTGKTLKESAAHLNRQEWDKFTARIQAEDDAYKAMTARQRAEAHRWRDPGRVEAGKSLAGVDQVVMRQANKAGDEANYWLDKLVKDAGEHQSTFKRKIRVAVKLLIEELAIARQTALHYQQRAEKAEK